MAVGPSAMRVVPPRVTRSAAPRRFVPRPSRVFASETGVPTEVTERSGEWLGTSLRHGKFSLPLGPHILQSSAMPRSVPPKVGARRSFGKVLTVQVQLRLTQAQAEEIDAWRARSGAG